MAAQSNTATITSNSKNNNNGPFFLNLPPLTRLPSYYEKWELIVDELSTLITNHELRIRINDLPLLLIQQEHLPTDRHWQRAYCVLTFLSQGYLWERGEEGTVTTLPKHLAIPWWEVSNKLGLPPVATYSALVLWNWSLNNTTLPTTLDNTKCPFSFTGTESEEWFYKIHQAIELAAVPGINSAQECLLGVQNNNTSLIINSLHCIASSIKNMYTVLNRMYEKCDPKIFYNDMRRFQGGSKNLLAFSNGLLYEGVSDKAKSYPGASAGQSSTLPVFDILLGVQHHGSGKEFLDQQRWHMPREHRQFLLSLSLQPSLREYVLTHQSNNDLTTAYNSCVKELTQFRSDHIILVTRYIVTPSRESTSNKENGSLATRGTGGSDFMVFLKTVRDDTNKCLIEITSHK